MPPPARHLATATTPPIVHAAVIGGRVHDAFTGAGLAAAVRLDWRREGEAAFRPFPATAKTMADGWFVFVARPGQIPEVDPDDDFDFRLTVEPRERPPLEWMVSVSGAQIAPHTRTIATSAGEVEVAVPGRLHPDIEIAVDPLPVALQGKILLDHDPATPAAGTAIAVVAPADPATATADAGGRFILRLPVAETVTLRLTHPSATADVAVRPAYPARTQVMPFSLDT